MCEQQEIQNLAEATDPEKVWNAFYDFPQEELYKYYVEQYKLYVELMDRTSARRNQTNKFYLTLLSAIFIFTSAIDRVEILKDENFVFVSIFLLGIGICFLWFLNIQSYKQLNKLRFKVIEKMEKKMPFQCFSEEWQIRDDYTQYNYNLLTNVERIAPVAISILFIVLLISLIS